MQTSPKNTGIKTLWRKYRGHPALVITLLVFFFPVGLYLLWRHTNWSQSAKVTLSIAAGIFFIYAMATTPSQTASTVDIKEDVVLNIDSPADDTEITSNVVEIKGKVGPSSAKVEVNGEAVLVHSDGTFIKKVDLKEGENKIEITATGKDESESAEVIVTRKKEEKKKEEKPKQETKEKEQGEGGEVDLDAEIRFSAVNMRITNENKTTWKGCTLEINPGIIKSGYKYKLAVLEPGATRNLPLGEFTKGGDRFNYFETKPEKVSISCADVGGKRGFGYYGS